MSLFEASEAVLLISLPTVTQGITLFPWAHPATSSAATPPLLPLGEKGEHEKIHTSSKLSPARSDTNHLCSSLTRLDGTIHMVSHQRREAWGVFGKHELSLPGQRIRDEEKTRLKL